jgi:uracil phosphoribosyltransferase
MDKVILKAEELDGYLTVRDKDNISALDALYKKTLETFPLSGGDAPKAGDEIIALFNEMGSLIQEICKETPQLRVYSFLAPDENRPEASRVIAKLRDVKTGNGEFVYYIQRSFEMLFKLAWGGVSGKGKNYLVVRTPVTKPSQNYAVHKINNIDDKIENTAMCVMLRGALLPSMILSKEIEEYSSHGYITPFALFSIKRNDSKKEHNMEYILNLEKSFFNFDALDGKDLVFADPMNATGGSLVTVIKYLLKSGVRPRSIKFFNVLSALKGALRVARAIDICDVYTLWIDPVLNENAYIMPGLGDAGDRINGHDSENDPRNIIRLIADYGGGIANLYRNQLREIENTVLSRGK